MRNGLKIPGNAYKLEGRGEYLLDSKGELNAGDKKDLMVTIARVLDAHSKGAVGPTEETAATKAEKRLARQNAVTAAYRNPDRTDWMELAATLTGKIMEAQAREGFARMLLQENTVVGPQPMLKTQQRNVTAVVVGTAGALQPQWVDDNMIALPEFFVEAHLMVSEMTIAQQSADILEDKYNEGLESMMVEEDRYWKKQADSMVGPGNSSNPLQLLVGGLTPANLSQMIQLITQWGIPVGGILTGGNAVTDILSGQSFTSWMDPISKYEIVMTGRLGTLMGINLSTDFHRSPMLKVLDPNDIYLTSTPEFHGQYSDRYGIQAKEQDGTIMGSPSRGWFMHELLSMALYSGRGVVKGKRI